MRFVRTERKFVNYAGIHDVAGIEGSASAVAGATGHDFRGQRVAVPAAHGAIVNFVRKSVVQREEQAAFEIPAEARLQGLVLAVTFVAAPRDLPKLGIGPLAA